MKVALKEIQQSCTCRHGEHYTWIKYLKEINTCMIYIADTKGGKTISYDQCFFKKI